MPKFVILAMETKETFAKYSRAEMGGIEKRYYAWTKSLAKKGSLVDGSQLVDRRIVEGDAGKAASREANTKEPSPGGYWIVKAKSMKDAVALCDECPHMDYGAVQVLQMG